jgi:hypothetical protein
MSKNLITAGAAAGLVVAAFMAGRMQMPVAEAAGGKLSGADYVEIQQLLYKYAHGIDTCGNNGYDYANVFTTDGVFIDNNSDAGYAAGGRVLARGRDALAELVGGGSKGCKTKLPWWGWSHLMLNPVITPTPDGAVGHTYLVQLEMRGPGTVDRHGGYEDVFVRTPEGWRIKSRTHVRNKAWYAPDLRSADLN